MAATRLLSIEERIQGIYLNYALITIDVEAWHGDRPIDRFIWGETNSGFYGLKMIIDLFDSLGVKGLFFVDFAECNDYGEDAIIQVARYIKNEGHTVGVHLHPDHILDPEREFLSEYSKDEQSFLIEFVTNRYIEAFNEQPIFFRAGKYSANRDTLEILKKFGYLYDFSEFYGRDWCAIKPPLTADHLCRYESLYEIPVTSFTALEIFGKRRIDKVDMEMSDKLLLYIAKRFAIKNESQVFILFGHSFSFLKNRYSENMDDLEFEKKNYNKFKNALLGIKNSSDYQFINPAKIEFLTKKNALDFNDANMTPSVRFLNPLIIIYYLFSTSWRIKSFNRNARIFLYANMLIAILFVFIIFLVLFGVFA